MLNSADLKALLAYHDDRYYNQDDPEITDAEYDALKAQYIELEGEYTSVPGQVSSDLTKVPHSVPIKSLEKVHTEDEVRAAIERLWPVVIEPKFDGLTIVSYPGTVQAQGVFATRGNGHIGEDVTLNAKRINGLNAVRPIGLPVRMEAVMKKSVFEELNAARIENGEEPFKNPRNAAAGMLRQKDARNVKGIDYYAYTIVGSTESQMAQLIRLSDANFEATPHWTFDTVDEAVAFVLTLDKHQFDFEIDGLVIKSDRPNSLAIFGETGHHPKNAVAYKFPPEGKWTTIDSVTYQVGRTGKVTPVAELAPVDLQGSTVARATLHNEAIMDALNLSEGCEVFVIKANDIIPAVLESRGYDPEKKFVFPTSCPVCGSALVKVNDQHFCQDPSCPSKLLTQVVHMAKRDALDIEGLSEETAQKMIDAGLDSPFGLFTWDVEDFQALPGFGKRSAEKLYNAIQARRQVELKRFLYAVGVPGVGRSASEAIANTFGTLSAFLEDVKNGFVRTKAIEGIGSTIITAIFKSYHLWTDLSHYVDPMPAVVAAKPDKQLTFVITGTLEHPRSYYENLIKAAGHKCSGSVSKKTSYVLVGEDAGSKQAKAEELGIPQLTTEAQLKEVL